MQIGKENEFIYTDIGKDVVKLPNDMRVINDENPILLISTIFNKLENKSSQSCIYLWQRPALNSRKPENPN